MFAIYFITFVVAACSLVYELVLAQAVSFLNSHTVFWYSLTLGSYLVAMGVGALMVKKYLRTQTEYKLLFSVELYLSLLGGLSIVILYYLQAFITYIYLKYHFLDLIAVFFLFFILIVVSIGFLTGLELPLLMRLAQQRREKSVSNRILAVDYFGALIGGLLFPLVLLPRFELLTISMGTGFINLLVACYLLFVKKENNIGVVKKLLVFVFFILFVGCFVNMHAVNQYFLKKYYYFFNTSSGFKNFFLNDKNIKDVERFKSPYQTIDLVDYNYDGETTDELFESYSTKYKNHPSLPKGYVLFIDGRFQLYSNVEELYHEYFAHVPVQLSGKVPENILLLGAGDGMLLRELVKYPQIKKITLVDIDPEMIRLARKHRILRALNNNAMADPRVTAVAADAFQFIKQDHQKYDAIYMDFPYPKDYNLSKLFSKEFYHFIYKSLSVKGFAVFDVPQFSFFDPENPDNAYPEAMWKIYFNTLKSAGFSSIIPYFSILEYENDQAKDVINFIVGDTQEMRVSERDAEGTVRKVIKGNKVIKRRMLLDFIKDHRNGYLMVTKEPLALTSPHFVDYGIELNIFNEQRYANIFDFTFPFLKVIDEKQINSIMRPKIPTKHLLWRVRVPY